MKRTAIQRRTPIKPGKARSWNSTLRSVGKKQARKNRRRTPLRQAYLAAYPRCETGCGRRSVDVHEPWTRARGGPIDDPRNFMAVARECHDWIHQHNDEAEERGWLVPAEFGAAWREGGGREQDRELVAA